MSKLQERNVLLEPWFSISIAGKELDEGMLKYVSEVQVEDVDEKLSMATINVSDVDKKWLYSSAVGKGSDTIVRLGHRLNNRTAFRGKITHVDADFPIEGHSSLMIYTIDTAVKMMEKRLTRTFKKKKVSDVVTAMCKEGGLEIEAQDTKTVLDHIPQNKETNLEFINRWAKKLGWQFFKTPSGKYYFGTKRKTSFPIETLGYKTGGMEIISFTPTFTEVETEDTSEDKEIEKKKGEDKKLAGGTNVTVDKKENKFAEKERHLLEGTVVLAPHNAYKPDNVYKFIGLGSVFDGHYKIIKVIHLISASGYEVSAEVVKVPAPKAPAPAPKAKPKAPTKKKPDKVITVKKGDNLWTICQNNCKKPNPYKAVAKANGLANDGRLIFPNQKITIPSNYLK